MRMRTSDSRCNQLKNARTLSISFSCLFLCFINVGCFSPKEDAAKLEETKKIWTAFPIYPGMRESYSSTTSGFGKVLISKHFQSKARYEEVRRFYLDRLTQDGWKLSSEKQLKDWGSDFGGQELHFRKADFHIAIEYAGERADYGWDYGISAGWTRWVK